MVDISRLLGAGAGESGSLLRQTVLDRNIDGKSLLHLLLGVSKPPKDNFVVTNFFCCHLALLLPYLDRRSFDLICLANKAIHKSSRPLTPPWPQKVLEVGSTVNSLEFSSNGLWLACGSHDGSVRLWNLRNGNCTLFEGHRGSVRQVSFAPDSSILASGGDDGSIRLWDVHDQTSVILWVQHRLEVWSIAFSSCGSMLASVTAAGCFYIWDTDSGTSIQIMQSGKGYQTSAVAFSVDGSTLATLVDDGESIYFWDLDGKELSTDVSFQIETQGHGHSLSYSSDGVHLACFVGTYIKLWRLSDGQLHKVVRGHSVFLAASCSPNGKLIASGDVDGYVRLWTVDNDHALGPDLTNYTASFEDYDDTTTDSDDESRYFPSIKAVAFTPNGQNLASAGDDGTIHIWDTRGLL
jgi:WD40 repeat protein